MNLEVVMAKTNDVAVLPQVIFKVMEMTTTTSASAQHLERSIVVDPGFSAKILAQANSAFYALPRKVTSIRDAVMFLGFKAVRQLAMTVGVFDLFVGKTDKESLRRRAWWRHSLDSAVCSRAIAQMVGDCDADEAYTCGLLHYIGKTLMDRAAPNEYAKVMRLIEAGASDQQAERAVYRCDHVEVTLAAGRKWGFPESLIGGLAYVNPAEPEEPSARLRALTAIGDKIAKVTVAGQGSEATGEGDLFPAWVMNVCGLGSERIPDVMTKGQEAIASSAKVGM